MHVNPAPSPKVLQRPSPQAVIEGEDLEGGVVGAPGKRKARGAARRQTIVITEVPYQTSKVRGPRRGLDKGTGMDVFILKTLL